MTPEQRIDALAFNAVGQALGDADEWLRLTVRQKVARAVIAAVLPEHEKQVRAKVAERIADVPEARDDEDPDYVEAYWDGRDDGARIARGVS
jgi:hypothetical protein